MTEQQQVYRDYAMEDNLLVQKSGVMHALFLENLAPFTAFDPDLNATYAANWDAQREICMSDTNDETILDQQQQHTQDLEEAKTAGLLAAEDLEYYVKKAFPGNKRIAKEFAFNKRSGLRARTLNLISWLMVMKKVADDYAADLSAVSMPPAVLTNLETAAQNVANKEIEQEYFKRKRLRYTRERMEKFNRLYAICKEVNTAAQSVFRNDYAKWQMFEI
jgi:hypothetical protein